jgi:outer membrane lipoprotein-sorting protein
MKPTPSVDEFVDCHVAACGGLKKIKSVQSLREKGRVTTGANREALVTRERKRPGRARFEFTVQGVTSVYVSNGQRGWRMSPFDGDSDPNPLPDEVVMEASEQGELERPLADWKANGHQVLFPRVVEVEAVGRPQKLRVVIEAIEVNPALDDARFEMPDSAP